MTDWRGLPVTVGCSIVYPSRQSSSVWMNEATVERINYAPGTDKPVTLTVRRTSINRGWREIQRPVVTLFNLKEVTVVGAPNVKTADFNAAKRGLKL